MPFLMEMRPRQQAPPEATQVFHTNLPVQPTSSPAPTVTESHDKPSSGPTNGLIVVCMRPQIPKIYH